MSVETNLRNRIAALLRAGLVAVQEAGDLPAFEIPEVPPVEQGRHAAHGDYASPICLGLARVLHQAPIKIAAAIAKHIPLAPFVTKVDVAQPGFINFTLAEEWVASQVPVILVAGETWGNQTLGNNARVQVEFVSANPTGPITIGSARIAVIGDALASVLEAAG
ncbi:MAG: hypothetical protein MUQ30_20815 [Anaerolineae bacterium]|nr:hypothetical protein [Anaerolineae bacterium]